jgi:hypothetical protein
MKKQKQIVTVSIMALVGVLAALIWTQRELFTPLDTGSSAP